MVRIDGRAQGGAAISVDQTSYAVETLLMQERDSEGLHSLPVTRWSLVARAGQAGEAGWQHALSELLTRYMPALRAHLLIRKRIRPDDVNDLLQGFVASKVLEQNLLGLADHRRGRFRTFLLTSLDHYVANILRERAAAKRSPSEGKTVVALDENNDVAASPGPDAFDLVWAQQVVRESIERMKFECEVSGRSDLWTLFHARIVGPLLEGREVVAYEELVTRLRYQSPLQATNALATAKRMFRRMLEAVVGEYAEDNAEVEEELADLKRILALSAV